MKAKILAELLMQNPDINVCIVDIRKHLYHEKHDKKNQNDDGLGNGVGIHPNFRVMPIVEGVSQPFLALIHQNDDYTKNGQDKARIKPKKAVKKLSKAATNKNKDDRPAEKEFKENDSRKNVTSRQTDSEKKY